MIIIIKTKVVPSEDCQRLAGDGRKSCPRDGWPASQKSSSTASIRVLSNICRGYTSKKESIEKYIIEELKPDVINLAETMLRNKAKTHHKDYFSFCLN